ncbi:hypothetical protein GCM10011609_87700 [Lentzea pudingi]|uniref:Uncharacterized protein n=1 Tax=Lentzea pudingi TaxID=1789439 RepID=A0ABQ2IWT0_9PSEU|nr:hypothetical protein GCM10011609_87700 [Lentzea pudingi]
MAEPAARPGTERPTIDLLDDIKINLDSSDDREPGTGVTAMATRPLPRSLDSLPRESLPGYLLRLAHRLDLSPARVGALTGLTTPGHRPSRPAACSHSNPRWSRPSPAPRACPPLKSPR